MRLFIVFTLSIEWKLKWSLQCAAMYNSAVGEKLLTDT